MSSPGGSAHPGVKIPVYRPDLSGNERAYVLDCLDSGWISSRGAYIERFEAACRDYIGTPHALSCSNGTTALHLAMMGLEIGPGDEVILPSFTYVASANAVKFVGATPVFADSRPDTWQIDPEDVERRITPRTRAVMAVHLYGLPCDLDALAEICRRRDLLLIEDAAEAFGSRIRGQHVGVWGDVATFSFFGNKTLTTGEGGLVVCHDPTLATRIGKLKNQFQSDTRRYWHEDVGYNFRMTNICAAIGLAQIERIETILEAKRKVAKTYERELANSGLTFQPEPDGYTNSYWMVAALARSAEARQAICAALEAEGIETRPFFFPAHTMPMFAGELGPFPVAEDLASRGFNLPSFPTLTEAELETICAAVRRSL